MTSRLLGQDGRLTFVDVAKGLAIVLVVYGHAARGLVDASAVAADGLVGALDYLIYVMHMPLFFLLSGLFFEHALAKGPGAFWRGRLTTLVYPYILWSLIQGTAQVALANSGAVNSPIGWERLVAIGWTPISPFWFLYALVFANVLMVFGLRLPLPLTLALALVLFVAVWFTAGSETVVDVAYGFLYFACGVAAARWKLLERIPVSAVAIAGLVAAWVGLAFLSRALGVPDRLAFPATAAGVAAALAISAALSLRSPRASVALSFLGQCSMAIFVMHMLAVGAGRVLLGKLGVGEPFLVLPLLTLIGIAVPCAAQLVATRLGLSAALGLPDPGRVRAAAARLLSRPRVET